jgi:hypothetical protein
MTDRARTLPFNGAGRVRVDVESEAVVVTPANGSADPVAKRVAATVVELYPLVPDPRRDVIVTSHSDQAGSSPLDPLIGALPADEGTAYFLQLSVISQQRTAEVLAEGGEQAEFAFVPVTDGTGDERSGAYHLRLAGSDMFVAYLLEVLG